MNFQHSYALNHLLIIFLILIAAETKAQCPTNISESSQADLVALMAEFPNCRDLPGWLQIGAGVTDLSPLSQIRSVSGAVTVHDDNAITDFDGLNNLESIGGGLSFVRDNMTRISGFQSLISIGGDLSVNQCANLTEITGLGALKTIGEDLRVESNPALVHFDGLESIQSVVKDVHVFNNDQLESVNTPFQKLETVGSTFSISTNERISSVDKINALTSIGGDCTIYGNDKLVSVRGFEALETIDGDLRVNDNDILISFNAMSQLKTCASMWFNRITDTVKFGSLEAVDGNVTLSANYTDDFEKLTSISGSLRLSSLSEHTPAFDALEQIGGSLTFYNQPNIARIEGYHNLVEIGGSLNCIQLPSLESIKGFSKLESIGEDLEMRGNKKLIELDAFQSLTSVGGDYRFYSNSALQDCQVFCMFLEEGSIAGQSLVFGNGGFNSPCASEEAIVASCHAPVLRVLDANPLFLSDTWPFPGSVDTITVLDPEEVIALETDREAIAADGETRVVLVAQFDEQGLFDFEYDGNPIDQPWGNQTVAHDGLHYGLALYKAPDVFPGDANSNRSATGILQEMIDINVVFSGTSVEETDFKIAVVPPPVVLVHGTFSSPETWTTSLDGGTSMKSAIEDAGYSVHTVDYTLSNGGDPLGASSFSDNALVVLENEGGIQDAIAAYREMGIAVTQADVIGHSLGGILPRVYASPNYNPDYKRGENFHQGDINRLVTLASTHYGSHAGEFQHFLSSLSVFDAGIYNAVISKLASDVGGWFAGAPHSAAVIDQVPGSSALASIGQTDIPAHAVTCRVDFGKMSTVPDPDDYNYFFGASAWLMYYFGPWDQYLETKYEKCLNPGIKAETTADGVNWKSITNEIDQERAFRKMMQQMDGGLVKTASLLSMFVNGEIDFSADINDIDIEFAQNIELVSPDVTDLAMSRDEDDDWENLFRPNEEPLFAQSMYSNIDPDSYTNYLNDNKDFYRSFTDLFRYLVFDNDHNDGTVRVESQAGGLSDQYISHLTDIWHGPAPKYAQAQASIISLLGSGMDKFDADGFPEYPDPNVDSPDEGSYGYFQKLYFPPEVLPTNVNTNRITAICRSGMVPAHASAFARVADRENVIVISRPVNYDATTLIAQNAATKVMDVKPKSSTWGPQKGYLPERQRYSKIWRVFKPGEREEKVKEYDAKVKSNLEKNITIKRQLQVKLCDQEYLVFLDSIVLRDNPLGDPEGEIVLVPIQQQDNVCTWTEDQYQVVVPGDCRSISSEDLHIPFNIMATPDVLDENQKERFLTADYDLLMIGFQRGISNPYNPPTDLEFRPGIGLMTDEQDVLKDHLNNAVIQSGYKGGNVTHHGPENQFYESPYIDYPLTVFMPDDLPGASRGEILSIAMGPKGFRDINLKRFVNSMRSQGFDLYDNPQAPGWKWTWNTETEKFQLPDSPDLGDYVAELKPTGCSKNGENIVPQVTCLQSPPFTAQHIKEEESGRSMRLSPNPVFENALNIEGQTGVTGQDWTIADIYGNIMLSGNMENFDVDGRMSVDISQLPKGIYFFSVRMHQPLKFVRL